VVLAAIIAVGLVAPAASAKGVSISVRDHVFVVGKQVEVAANSCQGLGMGQCPSLPRAPIRVYLVRAGVPVEYWVETTEPPRPARALGRLAPFGRMRFAPRAAGRFMFVALMNVGTANDRRIVLVKASPAFRVHPRGWES
jgi:hypothetical protein